MPGQVVRVVIKKSRHSVNQETFLFQDWQRCNLVSQQGNLRANYWFVATLSLKTMHALLLEPSGYHPAREAGTSGSVFCTGRNYG